MDHRLHVRLSILLIFLFSSLAVHATDVSTIYTVDFTEGLDWFSIQDDILLNGNSAWKQEYSHIMGKKLEEEKYRGLRITEEDRRAVRKYIKLAQQMRMDCRADQLFEKLSLAMNLPIERIIELAQLNSVTVGSDSYIGDNGEEQSLWDQIRGNENVSQGIEAAEDIQKLLRRLERAYESLQQRQKPIVSDMITAKICTFLTEAEAGKFTFISESVLERYRKNGTVPTQRDIAQKYGRDEASISRTINNFLKKLKRED